MGSYDPLFSHIISLADQLRAAAGPSGEVSDLQWQILRSLQSAGRRGLPQISLARACGISAATITRSVDDMSEIKLVTRMRHPHDRRTNVVVLTDRGASMLKASCGRVMEVENYLKSGLSEAELNDFTAKLELLNLRAKQFSPVD